MATILGPSAQTTLSATTAHTSSPAFNHISLHDSASHGVLADHEDEITRDPFSVTAWCAYVRAAATTLSASARSALFERAVQSLPRSYKLWKLYLDDVYETQARGQRLDAPAHAQLLTLYERALAQLPKMPRLWLDYTTRLREQQFVTRTRKAFDRALRALPITQHARIWDVYLPFVKALGLVPLAIQVYRRFLQLEPSKRDAFVAYLIEQRAYDAASTELVAMLDDVESKATAATQHAQWLLLCEIVTQHPDAIDASLNVDAILRSGIQAFSDEVGRLWCALATYYVRLGQFERARNVYEEALAAVVTVRDFSMVYDAFVKFIEAMLTAEMEAADDDNEDDDDVDHPANVDRLLKIYEDVADRRPLLLNAVLLRQNPHNVREWEKRIALQTATNDTATVLRTFADAVKTVDPLLANGQSHKLWIAFATFYEKTDCAITNARVVLQKAVAVPYRNEHELASVYCAWAELELRHDNFDDALALLRNACTIPATRSLHLRAKTALTARDKVYKSVKLWSLRLDLEESLGDLASTRAAYTDAFDLKIATPPMVLHYAAYLEEQKYFEESFRAFERGLALFPTFPHANELWQTYLRRFVQRYGGVKVERARDLFEQAIRAAPPAFARALFMQYAAFEEQFGKLRNVLAIYERATDAVPETEQLDVYAAYVQKAQTFFGVAKVREIYQRGIARLQDAFVAPLCLKFAALETSLGEIERARALYNHASQFCDPRQHETSFWSVWHAFEVAHGSEHSFLEMLRIKRSVVAQYAQVNYVASVVAPLVDDDSGSANAVTSVVGMVPATATSSAADKRVDAMAALEAHLVDASLSSASVEDDGNGSKKRKLDDEDGDASEQSTRPLKQQSIIAVQNDEEIDLDDEDEDEDDAEEEEDSEPVVKRASDASRDVEERELPATLFGEKLAKSRK